MQIEESKEGAKEEKIDRQAVMQYIQTLPQEEQAEIFKRFQSLKSDEERTAFGKELWKRMKAAQDKK